MVSVSLLTLTLRAFPLLQQRAICTSYLCLSDHPPLIPFASAGGFATDPTVAREPERGRAAQNDRDSAELPAGIYWFT